MTEALESRRSGRLCLTLKNCFNTFMSCFITVLCQPLLEPMPGIFTFFICNCRVSQCSMKNRSALFSLTCFAPCLFQWQVDALQVRLPEKAQCGVGADCGFPMVLLAVPLPSNKLLPFVTFFDNFESLQKLLFQCFESEKIRWKVFIYLCNTLYFLNTEKLLSVCCCSGQFGLGNSQNQMVQNFNVCLEVKCCGRKA